MHSNTSSNPVRRFTPFLITLGLGLSVAAHATEPESPEDMQPEIPAATIDSDGDGTMDAWDSDANGQPDLLDTDGDGRPDQPEDDGQPD